MGMDTKQQPLLPRSEDVWEHSERLRRRAEELCQQSAEVRAYRQLIKEHLAALNARRPWPP